MSCIIKFLLMSVSILSCLLDLFCGLKPLHSDFSSFSAIIRCCSFLKPGVLESLLCGNSFGRIIHEDLPQKIQEVPAELVVVGDDLLLKGQFRVSNQESLEPTSNGFIALTNLLEALLVSGWG